jgi:predicted dehydrogenase
MLVQYVLKALAAGKAVLSEKPISACFADAKKAIEDSRRLYRPLSPKPLWFVAENFRFESVFEETARLVPMCGAVSRVDLVAEVPLNYWCAPMSVE